MTKTKSKTKTKTKTKTETETETETNTKLRLILRLILRLRQGKTARDNTGHVKITQDKTRQGRSKKTTQDHAGFWG